MKCAQVDDGGIKVGTGGEFFIIDRQHEGTGARLLLRKLRQVAVAGRSQHLEAFAFDGFRNGANAETGRIVGPEVLVDDDDGEAKFHGKLRWNVTGACATAAPGRQDVALSLIASPDRLRLIWHWLGCRQGPGKHRLSDVSGRLWREKRCAEGDRVGVLNSCY